MNNKIELHSPKISWIFYILPPALVSCLTYAFYYPSLRYDFQFDDLANIKKHFAIRHHTIHDLFFSSTRWVMYWVNTICYKFVQFEPYLYRCLNVIFHITTGIVLYFLVLKLLRSLKKDNFFSQNPVFISYLVTLLFLLHPVQTQTISYVVQGQLEGLATLIILSIVLCFVYLGHSGSKIVQGLLAMLMMAFGFFSTGTKEIAIVSPFITLLVDWFFVSHGNWHSFKRRLPLHAALFGVVWGSYIYLLKPTFFTNIIGLKTEAHNNIGNLLTEKFQDKITPLHYCISQFKVILHYISIFFWPFGICVEYDWKLSKGFFSPDCFLPLTVLLSYCVYLYYRLRKNSTDFLVFASLWFFIFVVPRSSIIPSSELMADYKTYGASIGVFLLIAAGLLKAVQFLVSTKKYAHTSAALLIMSLGFGYATYNRNSVWSSGLSFWGNIIACAPGKVRAYNNYGVALAGTGKNREAIGYFKHAIALDKYSPDPLNNLAVAYSNLKEYDNAITTMRRTIQLSPNLPEGYNNLATFYIAKKDYENAEQCIQKALQLRAHYGKAYINWIAIHQARGNHEAAFECALKACTQADFDNEQGFAIYADMSMQAKKYDHAIRAYNKCLQYRPGELNYLLNLAQAYGYTNNIKQAYDIYQFVLNHNPNIPDAQLGFANCLHIMNKNKEAKQIVVSVLQNATLPDKLKLTAHKLLSRLG